MNETPASGGQAPASVDSLLALHDEAFVRAAYSALLGREVDPDGLNNYLEQLRTGESKPHIVAELARSAEGQQHNAELVGLAAVLAIPAPTTPTRWERLFKRLTAPTMEPLIRQLRIVDNTAARIDASLQQQSKQLAEIARLLEPVEPAPDPVTIQSASEPSETRGAVQVSRLPASLGRLFLQLKTAVAVKRGH